MNKFYYLCSCSTCKEIQKESGIGEDAFRMQEIRTQKITAAQLEEMRDLAGSYEALFSRRALRYKELGLKDRVLTEADYRNYILEEDTFLRRPVAIIGRQIFIGSEPKTRQALTRAVSGSNDQ